MVFITSMTKHFMTEFLIWNFLNNGVTIFSCYLIYFLLFWGTQSLLNDWMIDLEWIVIFSVVGMCKLVFMYYK